MVGRGEINRRETPYRSHTPLLSMKGEKPSKKGCVLRTSMHEGGANSLGRGGMPNSKRGMKSL